MSEKGMFFFSAISSSSCVNESSSEELDRSVCWTCLFLSRLSSCFSSVMNMEIFEIDGTFFNMTVSVSSRCDVS